MKKIIYFSVLIPLFCWACSSNYTANNKSEISKDSAKVENFNKWQTLSDVVNKDSVVATMIVQGYYGKASLSVAYVLLASGKVLNFSPAFVKSPFTLEEAKILLEAKVQGKLVYNSAD